jgi:DNA-binding NarL/FixJ family response regulator
MRAAPRVLIVEDQYFVAIDCEMHLCDAGFECIGPAATATQAIALAERHRPDFVIMDIRLASDVDGVQAAIEIFEKLGIRSIFSSGHADARMHDEAERAHPFAWLDKPYTSEELVRAARAAVKELDGAGRPKRAELEQRPGAQ